MDDKLLDELVEELVEELNQLAEDNIHPWGESIMTTFNESAKIIIMDFIKSYNA